MAVFCYKSDTTGEVIERLFPIGKAPQSITDDDGLKHDRCFKAEHTQVSASVKETVHGFPKVSKALPQGAGAGIPGISHTDMGEPVIHNRRAERNILAATGYTRDWSPRDYD